ncbi:MAG TPA: carboxypeptidase regulatory-like domain-containing protein, partial [Candidatus Polarisedimenticolia bacterium]|nr:carboxypeptidase regulatory-like domain-containing protein [Candidatus Polarisedimenticolia bacterium]
MLRFALIVLLTATVAGAPAAAQSGAQAGGIRGSVFDADFQVPVAEARVSIVGTSLAAATDDGGNFRIDNVPPGTYTLTFSKTGYERRLVAGVVVVAGRLAEVRTELASEVYEMEELVVTGGDLLGGTELGMLEIRAESIAMQDAISADLISKSGVSTAAGALSLVTGASVAEGKYATVRGLSDRYTGATLNGVRVPSADPRRRAIQIDLFPAGTIESVTVTKTFTPDLLGEFTGGGVDIRTKSVPDKKFFDVEVSIESDAIATGSEEFLTYQGGGVNTLGFAGSERDLKADTLLPAGVKTLDSISFSRTSATQADIDSAKYYDGQVRTFAPAMGVSRDKGEPNAGISLLGGNRYVLDGGTVFGALGALTYKRKSFLYEGGENNVANVAVEGGDLVIDTARSDQQGTENVLVGLLGGFVWDLGEEHELGVRLIGNQSADDTARLQVENPGQATVRQNQTLRYTERSVASGQLYGRHSFGSPEIADFSGVSLDWTGSYNYTRQDEPDVRFFVNDATFVDNDGDGVTDGVSHRVIDNSVDRDRTRRIWEEIEESNLQLAINAEVPFTQWTESRGNLKGGVLVERTDREFDRKSFFYRFSPQERSTSDPAAQCNQQKSAYSSGDPGALWTDVFSAPDRIGIAPDYVTCDFFVQ